MQGSSLKPQAKGGEAGRCRGGGPQGAEVAGEGREGGEEGEVGGGEEWKEDGGVEVLQPGEKGGEFCVLVVRG